MFRTPFVFLLTLLAGAAFACSDTVPPPGATLSGYVYHDANANGARDSCDSGESVRQIAKVSLFPRDGEGAAPEGFTREGAWTIKDVPPGDYILTLAQPDSDSYWLTTAPNREGGEPRYELSLKGFEALEGLDFGVATERPINARPDRYAIYGIAYEDKDGDGKTDVDECLLPGSPVFTARAPQGTERSILGHASPLRGETYLIADLSAPPDSIELVPAFREGLYWTLTSNASHPLGCFTIVAPVTADNQRVGIANVGFQRVRPTSTLSGNVFNDENANAKRDPGERGEANVRVIPESTGPRCVYGELPETLSLADGSFEIAELPEGSWKLTAFPSYGATFNHYPVSGEPLTANLTNGQTTSVDLAYRYAMSPEVTVEVREDLNGDGAADPDEPGVAGMYVCFESPEWYEGVCELTDEDGIVSVRPAPATILGVYVRPTFADVEVVTPVQEIQLNRGSQWTLIFFVRRG